RIRGNADPFGGLLADDGNGRAAIHQKAHGLAIDLTIDPKMPVSLAVNADGVAFHDRFALPFGQKPMAEGAKVIPQGKDRKGGTKDEEPGSYHLEALPHRQTTDNQCAAHEHQAVKQIDEAESLIAVVQSVTS